MGYRKKWVQIQFQCGFFLLFILSNVIIFQPWVLDNTKVFYIAIFGMSTVIADLLFFLWNLNIFYRESRSASENVSNDSIPIAMIAEKSTLRVVCIIVFLTLIFSGVLCTIRETGSYQAMYDKQDVELALWFVENTPSDARVLVPTKGTHFRPSSALGGRTLIASYWGWISNHGVPNYVGQNQAVNDILDGKGNPTQYLKDYRVDYIVLDVHSLYAYNLRFIHSVALRVAANGRYIVYKVLPQEFLQVEDCNENPKSGMNEQMCYMKGCNWIPATPGIPWCQKPPMWDYFDDEYVTNDCGWFGISERECNSIDCSFYPDYSGPHCQLPHGLDDTIGRGAVCNLREAEPDNNCSQYSEYQCKDRGCEWTPNNQGKPYCIYLSHSQNRCENIPPAFASLFNL